MLLKKIKTLSWLLTGKKRRIFKSRKRKKSSCKYAHNTYSEKTHSATSEIKTEVYSFDSKELKDICYFIPCPKSPHGCDVDPTGEYIVGSGKLAALIPVFSYDKMQKAIAANKSVLMEILKEFLLLNTKQLYMVK
jgi:nitrous-oxide reductase